MSIPHISRKHPGEAVIELVPVIQERKNQGLHPSGPIPDRATQLTS